MNKRSDRAPTIFNPQECRFLQQGIDPLTPARGPGGERPLSPVFGRTGGRTWGALVGKHLEPHLGLAGVQQAERSPPES